MRNFAHLILCLFLCVLMNSVSAQISQKGLPPTVIFELENAHYPEMNIPAPDVARLLEEDTFTDKHGIAMRFGVSTPTHINLAKDGSWEELKDGSSICRFAISSKKAQALILYYSEFSIPEGGELFLYNHDKSQIIGAFNSFNNRNGGAFATEMIQGEISILEYHQTSSALELPIIIVDEVSYVYRTAERIFNRGGFGGSDTCEVNVKCPEGNAWQNQAGGLTRIIVKQGSSQVWCSGSLLNNTREDHSPYLLTADHCGPYANQNDYDQWIFNFRYQSEQCEDPANDTSFNSYTMVGATKIAAAGGSGVKSDFKLLLLNESVPLSYNPYFNGWSAYNDPSPQGFTIHHPQGDIKKISSYTAPLSSSNWGSTPNTHWKVVWAQTQTNWGVTEGGSSGSPIFNDNGQIVGQLTGGDASCSFLLGPDYYGKFSYSWNEIGNSDTTMLQPWLDPDNSGVLQIGGLVNLLESTKLTEDLFLYPNPTKGISYLDFGSSATGIAEVSIYDMSGRLVYKKDCNLSASSTHSFNLTNLDKGVYFLTAIVNNKSIALKLIR